MPIFTAFSFCVILPVMKEFNKSNLHLMAEGQYKMNIIYLKGDATAPTGGGKKIIVHICNDLGMWGKGFVMAISKRWRIPEQVYKLAFAEKQKPVLGDVQFVGVGDNIIVANIIGQHGIRSSGNAKSPAPIRYDAVRQGLTAVAKYAVKNTASVHMPRIGCGLAGGTWDEIEPIIMDTLIKSNVATYVYDFK